ncbi:MAG: hypothetical protein ACPGSD_16390 [Flavobacteriales bacterium]
MTYQTTVDKDFEKSLVKHTERIRQEVQFKLKAISDLTDSNAQTFLHFVLGHFQILISDLSKSIQFKKQFREYQQLIDSSKLQIEDLEKRKHTVKEAIRKHQLNNEKENIRYLEDKLKQWRFVMVVILLIVMGENAFNIKAFQLISSNIIVATLIATTLGICLVFTAHFIPKLIRQYSTDKWSAFGLWILSISIMTAVFYFLAQLRMAYFTVISGTQTHDITSIHFVIINLIFFITSCLLSYFYGPQKGDKQAYLKNKDARKALETHQKELKDIQTQLQSIPEACLEKERLISGLLTYLHEMENHIDDLYIETVRTALLDYQLQTNSKHSKIVIPPLHKNYTSTKYQDYV